MHQTMKKVWAVLLVVCLVLGTIPFGAQAAVLKGEDYITQQLSLGEDLVLHLRASLPEQYEDLAKDATATITYAGKVDTYQMGDMAPDENGVYDLAIEMAVAEMTETINVRLDGKFMGTDVEAINENYSIRDYLVAIIEGDYSQTTKDLCLELLNMGAWAQLYFNHNISNLANAGYDIQPANPVPDEIPTVKTTGKVDGIRFYGASVRFLSQTAVRFYFEADSVEGYTFTIGDTTYEPVAKDGMYYIETPGINPQNMSDVITVNVTDGSKTLSVDYAPIWYFIRNYHKTEDEYNRALMEASYSYYKACESYKTQICMDVEITTLSGTYESVGLGFYPLNFEGDINDYTDRIEIPTNTTYTVKLDQGKYLVDGEFLGIGVTVLGGPTWDATLPDGSPDRHNIQVSNLRLEGPEDRPIDLTLATIASGTAGTGYTNANAGGTAAVADGVISLTNGFFTDGYKITFNEIDTYLKLDMEINTLSGNYESIGIGFYPYDFEGDINNHIDKIEIPTGTTYTVKLDAAKYLVDGEIPGIGIAVLGGPTWDAKLEDGYTADRHSITVSNIRLEGELNQSIGLSRASLKSGQDGTGFTNANAGGTATVADGIISITNGFFTDGYKITFFDESVPEPTDPTEPEVTDPEETQPEETEPPVEEADTYLCVDMLFTTLGGSTAPVEIGFYPYNFEGDINNHTDKITITAGTKTTVKLDAAKYMVDGNLTGLGFVIFGGPAWDAKLEDGYTPDRHTITISAVYLEGEQNTAYDLSKSVWANGNNGTGYTNANGSGAATIGSEIVITNGFQYDGHKISLVEDTRSYVTMDMQIDTLGGDWANDIEIRFYNYDFQGNPHDIYTDIMIFKAGEKQTVKLDAEKYLVDGELTGFGIGIFGGPAWDAKLPDGYTPDRHTVTISNVKLEGAESKAFNLNKSTVTSGTADTGYTSGNGNGKAAIGESIVISDGFCYDVHKISLVEDTRSFITMDMLFTTLGGSTAPVEIGFYPSNFEGDINNWTDKLTITAGTTANIRLDAEKYMVDGQVSGIGFAIFGGPAWDAKLPDGYTPDRHTLTISNARLEGAQSMAFDLSQSTWANGNNGTGFTNANGSGAATMGQSIVITNGFQYDGHKISLVEDTSTYIEMDLLLTTLGNSTDSVEIRFCNYGQTESVHTTYTNILQVTAGTKTTVRFKVDEYLVDGQLPGFGIAIFGGPEWNTQLEDGTYDRHSVVISDLRLTGVNARDIDLSTATATVGIPGSNTGGQIAIVDGEIVISGGFRYDGHLITF